MSPAPRHWAVADDATKHPGHVGLIAHPACQRDLTHGVLSRQQQPLRQLDPLTGHVSHRRLPEASFESTREMASAETNERGEILYPDR